MSLNLPAIISTLDRIYTTLPDDALRVATIVRAYLDELNNRGAISDETHASLSAVLYLWHEEKGLPWVHNTQDALQMLFGRNERGGEK